MKIAFSRRWPCLMLALLAGCNADAPLEKTTIVQIHGRGGEEAKRPWVYQAKIPLSWIQTPSDPSGSSLDTKKPLCELAIVESEDQVRITIHNFPSSTMEQRVPCMMQIDRWKRQFDSLTPEHTSTHPEAFAGFSGLLLEAEGIINKQEMALIGLSMQIGDEHYRTLNSPKTVFEDLLYEQMRADVTIKALGPARLINKHKSEILTFFKSFELINEIPSE